ncbi:MAG: hypothetical protein ABIH03_10995, partial [Pseudomonadota bacterium]
AETFGYPTSPDMHCEASPGYWDEVSLLRRTCDCCRFPTPTRPPAPQGRAQAMEIEKHRVVSNQFSYAEGKRPDVPCMLCAVAGGSQAR